MKGRISAEVSGKLSTYMWDWDVSRDAKHEETSAFGDHG
jgi:hypothetical protein